jgi:Tfp pilus assembly protein PilN
MMNNINLLPKISKSQKIFVPALVAIVSITAIISLSLLYFSSTIQQTNVDKEQELTQLSASIQNITNLRQLDTETSAYKTLYQAVETLKSGRYYWNPVFQLITGSLPETSRLLSADVPNEESSSEQTAEKKESSLKVSMQLEFAEFTQIAEYMSLLERSPLVARAEVPSIVKVTRTYTSTEPESTGDEETSEEVSESELSSDSVLLNELRTNIEETLTDERFSQSDVQENPDDRSGSDDTGFSNTKQFTVYQVTMSISLHVPAS